MTDVTSSGAHTSEPPQQFTSFGFLPAEEDQQTTHYGFSGLFSKVRTAFGGQAPALDDVQDGLPNTHAHSARPRPNQQGQNGLPLNHPLPRQLTTIINENTPSGRSNPRTSSAKPRLGQQKSLRMPSLRSAPSVASIAPSHITAHSHSQSDTHTDFDDTRSILTGTILEDEETQTTHPLGHNHSQDSSTIWTSIPGFPLSKDLLADDNQSIRSFSSKPPDDRISHIQRPLAPPYNMDAQEAFRRLTLRGAGDAVASKEFWMPDNVAKECAACGASFNMARRKHHCRRCGQIFCSKCTSHLLAGSKIGLSGLVRVCDTCSNIPQQDSVGDVSFSSSRIIDSGRDSDGRVRPDMISAPLEAAVDNAPQGRFAANALFSAVTADSPDIDSHSYNSRSLAAATTPPQPAQAPFRKRLMDEDHLTASDTVSETYLDPSHAEDFGPLQDDSMTSTGSHLVDVTHSHVLARTSSPIAPSTIAFPSTDNRSPVKSLAKTALDEARAKLLSDPSTNHDNRARLVSDAAVRAFRRSRLRSRLNTNDFSDKGPLAGAKDDFADSRPGSRLGSVHTLGAPSLAYLRRLLDQSISRAGLADKQVWIEVLLPLILKVIGNVKPNVYGQGRMMGLRKYVKIKRIPGGVPADCSLLNGYICSHNVASKSMIRKLPLQNPRVAMVTFPLSAVRGEGYYTSLDNLAASEREYTRILVARVLALRPHLLIVKSQVSRLALAMLEQAGIVVVWNVPDSSKDAIARVTQSDIITSVDRLALSPRLGRCGSFNVDTYHSRLLQGKKRSFLQFTGTPKDLGCSVVLRGGGQALLGQIKSILELCLLTAHNLRLEEAMRDTELLSLLPEPPTESARTRKIDGLLHDSSFDASFCSPSIDAPVSAALREYSNTLMSISAHIRVPPPYPLVRLQEERLVLSKLEAQLHEKESSHVVRDAQDEQDETGSDSGGDTPRLQDQSHDISSEDETASMDDRSTRNTTADAPDDQDDGDSGITLDHTGDVQHQVAAILPSREEMSLKTRCAMAQARHALDAKYVSSMNHDESLTPFAHQKLSVLHAVVSSATRKPCIGPRIEHLEYYGQDDYTLGNYLEIKCQNTSKICHAKECGLQDILHYDAFIHNDVRIQLFCERFVCPIAGQEDSLLTWEFCKVCEAATPVSVVNEDAKAYSWAKLLEAHFYTDQSSSACPHPKLVDRIRYFAYKNLAFRIHVERIHPYEVVVPGLRLFMRPDAQSRLRSEEALGVSRRADAYFHSVGARLKSLEQEIGLGRDAVAAMERHRSSLEELASVARKGRKEVNQLMVSEIKASQLTDTLFLSKVRRRLQEIVVTVDRLFLQIEKAALPKERDIRRLTTNHLSRMFAERDSTDKGTEQGGMPPAVEADELNSGLPSQGPESSVAALARVVDSSALGIPQFGLGFDILSPSASRSRTPLGIRNVSASEPVSNAGSAGASQSNTPRPISRNTTDATESSSSPDFQRPDSQSRAKPEGSVEDSDGNSSPTTLIKGNLARPKPRRARPPPVTSATEDSSCAETGNLTDSRPGISSLVGKFESPLRDLPKPKAQRPNGLANRTSSANSVPQARSSTDVADSGNRTSLSRPTSPLGQRSQTPTSRLAAARVRQTDGNRREPQPSRAPPPSSYRAPSSLARASESESDGTSITGRLRLGMSSTNSARPAPTRRASGSSDVGGGSTLRPQRRRVSGQVAPSTPISRVPIPSSNTRGRVSTIARHFDRINREAEKERDKQKRALALRARRALPPSASTARVAEYTSVTAAVESDESSDEEDDRRGNVSKSEADDGGEADSEDEDGGTVKRDRERMPPGVSRQGSESTITAGDTVSKTSSPAPAEAAANAVEKLLPHLSDSVSATPSGDAERGSLLKTISSFWASRTGTSLPLLEYPLSAEQHLFADSPLLLREDEPSSVIAFTLVSNQYQERMRSLRAGRTDGQSVNGGGASDIIEVGDSSMASWNNVSVVTTPCGAEDPSAEVEATLRMPDGVHLRFDYESGASRFHCRILFSEQFAALRRCCGCEDSLVSSLARCVKWDSTGGKSGMTFLKTQDDRLVLKQLSSSELASFGTFAPHYFAHMAECLMHGKPTTLAKIFGLFRISMRNSATGKSFKLDVVVMENLFYGRQCTRIFDLKGSMRNRHVKETGAPGEVLLDENLVEISRRSPLYIREASKNMLKQALKHDVDFLAGMNIMDYSVIVGIDSSKEHGRSGGDDGDAQGNESHHELVVGIIDFLRSYTWDKRVETFVKEQSSLLAGGGAKGELPTVITPKQYAQRFLTFLDSILLLSPDSWYSG